MKTKVSHKLITEWDHGQSSVGIWDNANRGNIRLYPDRAICTWDYVSWSNNTGSLATGNLRITGSEHSELISLAQFQIDDDADYTMEAMAALDSAKMA